MLFSGALQDELNLGVEACLAQPFGGSFPSDGLEVLCPIVEIRPPVKLSCSSGSVFELMKRLEISKCKGLIPCLTSSHFNPGF